MTTRRACPVPLCGWFHNAVAAPSLPDWAIDTPPWCAPTWATVPSGYGTPLTDTQIIAAHVATHPRAERNGRMPSRAEVESAAVSPRSKEPAL